MRYIGYGLIVLFIITNLFGCARSSPYVPRKSFVKVSIQLEAQECEEELCQHHKIQIKGSGSVVANKRYTYIMTAGHICDEDMIKSELRFDTVHFKYLIHTHFGLSHEVKVYKLDKENDICLLRLKRINLPALKLRSSGPQSWEKVYNLAAPTGFADTNYVPLLEGNYSGFSIFRMIFTIPAIGGSSGSPIFDSEGRLVGMIVAVHSRFPFISYSPHFPAIQKMINSINH